MALTPGTRLGVYEVTAQIGAGGMGQVFRAHDAKLNRDVALKILPDSFAGDPDRLTRFTREAQTLAALNHPNIAYIHGLEESDGVRALVMELVEGDDLSQRIARGPIPLDEALPIARQIADALEAAHDHGIVHRDLKPANIKVRPDGTVKVLDFGLAKALDAAQGSGLRAQGDLTNSPTVTSSPLTQHGVILGTAAYMSPEQAAGRAVDKRSDVWAFGVVLFEMVTGRPVFAGPDAAHILAAVLKSEPDWTTLPAETPEAVRRLLRRCLVKDRKRRLDSVAAGRLEIEEAMLAPSASIGPTTLPERGSRSAWWRALPWVVTGLFGVALVSALFVSSPWRSTSAPATRITLLLSRDNSLSIRNGAAISPDGRAVTFVARSLEGTQLYLRRLDEWEPRALPLTNGAILPFFSPDGRWIAFFRGGNLEKMPVSGGPSQIICRAGPYTGRWSDDGTIVFGDWPNVGLWRVSADGGTPQPIIRPSEGGGVRYFWPEPLPAGKGMLFTIFEAGAASVAVVPPGAATPRILVESGSQARYVPTGHLIYVAASRLVAVPFDLDRLEVRGGATLVLDDINETALIPYDVSDNGVLVYQTASSLVSDIVWKDRQGVTVHAGLPARQYGTFPNLSPDGGRLSVQILEGVARNIWTGRVANEPLTRLTFGNDDVNGPWSRDGKHLFYSAAQDGKHRIHSIATDGSGKAERLADGSNSQFARSVSPSGDTILFDDLDPETGRDIWELSVSRKESKPLVKTPFNDGAPEFSPRGQWIAYHQADESGRLDVYVQAYPGPGAKRRVSSDGGTNPFWSRTGRELFYWTSTALFSVSIPDGDDLRPGPPVRVFALTPFDEAVAGSSPDDQRFLMVQARPSSLLNLVENFFDELKRVAPAK